MFNRENVGVECDQIQDHRKISLLKTSTVGRSPPNVKTRPERSCNIKECSFPGWSRDAYKIILEQVINMEPTKTPSMENDDDQPDIVDPEEELRLEHERYLRTLAEFENYRKRIRRERESASRQGTREIILSLLEVVDEFDRAFEHISDRTSPLFEGIVAIHRKLLGLLEAQGITPFISVGQTFNPDLHEAIASVQSGDDYEPGQIVDEFRRGYLWGDELLRPAQVRVAV